MRAIIYKGLETKPSEEIKLKEGKLAPQLKHLGDCIAISGGQKCGKNYCVKKNDIITVRVYAGAPIAIVAAIIAVPFIVVGIVKLVNLYQDLKKLSQRKTINRKVESLPYLGGAENQLATGQTQPMIIGEHLFTPYFIDYPLSRISGTDGRDQFTYRVYELGFKEQVIKEIKAGKASLKKFALSEPQEGKFNLDATSSLYDADAFFEITQGGEFLTEEFNKKYYHLESGAILPKKKDGVQGELNFELPANSKYIEVAILFNGLIGYSDDGSKTSRSVEIKPQYSLDGSTWTTFAFDGATNNVFTRITQEQIRFTGRKTFTYAEIKNQTDIIKVRLLCPTVASTKQGYDDCYCVYVQAELFNVEESKKQNKFVAEKRLPDKQRALSTRLGLKIKATEDNQDKLGQINVITQGVAPTPAGNWINKTPTSNPASWLYEILTSETHPLSAITKDEIDLASFTELFSYCKDEGLEVNAVLLEARPKQQVLEMVLRLCNSVLYRNMTGQLQVATDKLNSQPIALFTSQNVLSTTIDKNLERKTDGVLINYIDSSLGYEQASHLVMHRGETETPDSVISTVQTEGITSYEQVVKFGRRLMATETLRPKTVKVQTSLEGVFYTPMSKVLLQTETLKTGKGNGEIKKVILDDNDLITHLELYDNFEFAENETNIIVVSLNRFDGNFTHTVANFEIASAEGKLIELATPILSSHANAPKKGDTLAYGVATKPIISEMIIAGVEENANGYTLTLVDYNEAIYDSGEIPEYKPSWASDIGDKPPATLPPLTFGDLETYVELEAPDTPTITAIAQKTSLRLSASVQDGAKNGIAKIEWSLKKDNAYELIGISRTAEFVYTLDDYYEAADFATWRVKAKVFNANGKGTESLPVTINTDKYGTWILNPPTVTNSTSKRSIILQLSTPSGSREQYSTIQYRVQVQKAGEEAWYKPDLVSDPYADEDNYKDGEGYETVANTFIQSVPMESQEAGIKTTAYNYRIVGVSVETQAESEPTIITATATASTAMDIYDESIGVEKLAVKDLSAISGTFGDIKSDEIEKDATNFWILSKANSSLGYGRAGEFCVGTTASVEPFDLATNPTGYKDEDEFLHYLPSKGGSTLKGLFLKLANFIVDAIGSTITGAFRVEQKASRKALFEVDDINQKVSGIQEQRGYDNIVIGLDYDGLYDSDVIKTIADGSNLVSITGQKKLIYNTQTHTETVTDDLSVDVVKHNTEIWGLVDGVPASGAKKKIGLTSPSAFEVSRRRRTCAVVEDKVYIPEDNGTALEIIDTVTGQVTTIENAFTASRYRRTCAVAGEKIYIPQYNGTALEIIDTATGQITTIENAFEVSHWRSTCAVVEDKVYIPQDNGKTLEIYDTVTGAVETIENAFASSRRRYTCAVVEDKVYIPEYGGRTLEIYDTTTGEVETIENAFAASRLRNISAVVGDKVYIPPYGGTALEIIDTVTGAVETDENVFTSSRNRYTCAVVEDKVYIPEYGGRTLEIYDTVTGQVTTIESAFTSNRYRNTCAVVGDKIYIPQNVGTALEIVDTNPHLVSITSDGANIRGISRSEYYKWTTDIAEPTNISASEILAFVFDGGFTWALDLTGGQILKDTEVIATTAQSGYTSAIYSQGKFYANKGNTIREINASTGEARVLTLTEQAQHKLFVFDGKLYALPAKGATRITEIDIETLTVVKTAQKDFLQLAGNPLSVGNTAYIRQRGLMTEMTGLEWGLVTSRQLVEIGSGFVSREIATDGTRRLTTAGGEAIDFDADGDLVATHKGELAKPKFTGKIKTEKAMNKVIFYDEDDEVVNPVNAIAGLEIGDVVWIKYEGYDKLHTVELLEAGYMIVNYEHCDTRGKGSLMLEDKTNVSATVELLTKWYNAPLGLGQAWVGVVRTSGMNYESPANRSIQCSYGGYDLTYTNQFFVVNGVTVASGNGNDDNRNGRYAQIVVPASATYSQTGYPAGRVFTELR